MIEIREGKLSDSERIVEFEVRMAQETEGLHLDRDVVNRGVRGVFQEPTRGTYWVAEEEGEILGVLLAIPEWSDWRNGTVLLMGLRLYVDKHNKSAQEVYEKLGMNKDHYELYEWLK
jgi:hypothetical protein